MKIVAVMPAFNEAPRIAGALAGVLPVVSQTIVVDDGSRDETTVKAREAGALVLRHAVNRGQGAALKTGTLAALAMGADVVVHIDADGQHDPHFLPSLVGPIERGEADVVFGSRFMGVQAEGMPLRRRVLLSGGRLFSQYALGIPWQVTDPQSGLRAFSARAAEQIPFSQDGMAHCSEILRLVTRSSMRWQEVPIRIRYTADTLAKGNQTSDAFKIVWKLFIGSFQR